MKERTISITCLALMPIVLFTFASCSSTPTPAPAVGSAIITYKKGVPGEVIVQTVKVTATVTAMDRDKRKATLRGADGKEFAVQIGREAGNLDQVGVGDRITVTLTQKLSVSLDDKPASSVEAPTAGKPGLAAETIQATGKIVAIDVDRHEVTLQFEDGSAQTLPARPDTDLSRLKLGEREEIRVTEMTVLAIEKPQ